MLDKGNYVASPTKSSLVTSLSMILRWSCGVSSETVKMKVSFHSGSLPAPEKMDSEIGIELSSASLHISSDGVL